MEPIVIADWVYLYPSTPLAESVAAVISPFEFFSPPLRCQGMVLLHLMAAFWVPYGFFLLLIRSRQSFAALNFAALSYLTYIMVCTYRRLVWDLDQKVSGAFLIGCMFACLCRAAHASINPDAMITVRRLGEIAVKNDGNFENAAAKNAENCIDSMRTPIVKNTENNGENDADSISPDLNTQATLASAVNGKNDCNVVRRRSRHDGPASAPQRISSVRSATDDPAENSTARSWTRKSFRRSSSFDVEDYHAMELQHQATLTLQTLRSNISPERKYRKKEKKQRSEKSAIPSLLASPTLLKGLSTLFKGASIEFQKTGSFNNALNEAKLATTGTTDVDTDASPNLLTSPNVKNDDVTDFLTRRFSFPRKDSNTDMGDAVSGTVPNKHAVDQDQQCSLDGSGPATTTSVTDAGDSGAGFKYDDRVNSMSPTCLNEGNDESLLPSDPADDPLLTRIWDTVNFIVTTRGLAYEWGANCFVPPPEFPQTRWKFAVTSFFDGLARLIIQTIISELIAMVIVRYNPEKNSIFFAFLPWPQRYLLSTVLHVLSGFVIISSIRANYNVAAGLCVAAGFGTPDDWPPIMLNPWGADSVHAFWQKHWHQHARQIFLLSGGIPAGFLTAKLLLKMKRFFKTSASSEREVIRAMFVFGTFLSSGLLHEIPAAAGFGKFDSRIVWGFLLQGVFVMFERCIFKITGRRVTGSFGRVIAYISIIFCCQGMTDSWFGRCVPANASTIGKYREPLIDFLFPPFERFFNIAHA